MREADYQAKVIERLRDTFLGCVILKNDSSYLQGVPDLLVLFQDKWAMLEIKAKPSSRRQPNQEYYIDVMNQMSYAAFVYPENEEEVFFDLQYAFDPPRSARLSKR